MFWKPWKWKIKTKSFFLISCRALWHLSTNKIEKRKTFFFDRSCKFWNFKSEGDEVRVKLEFPYFHHVHLTSFRNFFSTLFQLSKKLQNWNALLISLQFKVYCRIVLQQFLHLQIAYIEAGRSTFDDILVPKIFDPKWFSFLPFSIC